MPYICGTEDHPLGRPVGAIKGGPLGRGIVRQLPEAGAGGRSFHTADPHPGNVFITDDGRIALLDLGMVGHTAPAMQEHLAPHSAGRERKARGDEAADTVVRMSERTDIFDSHAIRISAADQPVGVLAPEPGTARAEGRPIAARCEPIHARQNGLWVPSEMTLLGKTLLQLDEVGRILDPTFDPNASIRRNARRT